jgi:hypothetical protein
VQIMFVDSHFWTSLDQFLKFFQENLSEKVSSKFMNYNFIHNFSFFTSTPRKTWKVLDYFPKKMIG